jgi:hypothetical protein
MRGMISCREDMGPLMGTARSVRVRIDPAIAMQIVYQRSMTIVDRVDPLKGHFVASYLQKPARSKHIAWQRVSQETKSNETGAP